MPKQNSFNPRLASHQPIDALAPVPRDDKRGFALISVAIILGLVLAYGLVVLDNSLNLRRVQNYFQQALAAEQIAEAGINKAIFCVNASSGANCGGTYGTNYAGESNVSFGGGSFTTTVSGSATLKTITSVGKSATGQTKTVKTDITTDPTTIPFNFAGALQAGAGGVTISNSVVNDGDVVSAGDIVCASGGQVKGNATVTAAGGKISGCSVTKSAYADKVLSDTVTLNAYFKNSPDDIAGSTVSGTKYPNSATPTPQPLPPIDVAYWNGLAAAGTVYNGNYNATDGTTIGPMKINGDFTMAANATVTIAGPIWITGNMTTSSGGKLKLASSFGSAGGIIIMDGKFVMGQDSDYLGSGTAGSYMLLVSTNNSVSISSPAMLINNGSTVGIFYALNGLVRVSSTGGSSSANVPAIIGYKVAMDNSGTINGSGAGAFLNPLGLAASGSTGVWRLKSGTWREYK